MTVAAKSSPGIAGKLRWYAHRLRLMSGGEILRRGAQSARTVMLVLRHGQSQTKSFDPAKFAFATATTPQLPNLDWDLSALPASEDELVSGVWPALGYDWMWKAGGMAWHVAPDTGREWPRTLFARISYRPGNQVGDARIVWEPARLQQLIALALVSSSNGGLRPRAIALLREQFLDFVEHNPFLEGIHYTSAMECALRMIALFHAFDLVRPWLQHGDWQQVLRVFEAHARLIENRLSLDSSAGNHTVAEAAGLVYAGLLLPEMPRARHWRDRGLNLLRREAERQVLPHGSGVEQAFAYHLFVVELLGLVMLLLRRHSIAEPALENSFSRGQAFLTKIAPQSRDELPPIGDSDNGYALSPALRLVWTEEKRNCATGLSNRGGYVVMAPQTDPSTRLIFDCAPLGMPPAFGHGHADALSVIYERAGRPLLIDTGTLAYGGDPAWRKYFRGTSAHNTVCVDREDQATQVGPFLWSGDFQAGLAKMESSSDGRMTAVGWHNGYTRLGVEHWRAVAFDPGGFWIISDMMFGDGKHEFVLHWHVDGEVKKDGNDFVLSAAGETVRMSAFGGDLSIHEGDLPSRLGWKAPLYGRLEKATTLRVAAAGPLPHTFVTLLCDEERCPSRELVDRNLRRSRELIEELRNNQITTSRQSATAK